MERNRAAVVLVIEDHEDSRDLYVTMLTAAGFRCVATGVPDEAIRHVEAVHFDAIVMDLGLPRLVDGLALALRLRGLADAAPLIAVTGHRLEADSATLFHAHFMKPLEMGDLVAALRRVVDSYSVRLTPATYPERERWSSTPRGRGPRCELPNRPAGGSRWGHQIDLVRFFDSVF